ncbi:MAG TPA: class I SAM-dependent methyltransferase [Chloroflexota bacterium]|nr:class I SAM-dependent methyltransferase [Chloroflexota bacterium]
MAEPPALCSLPFDQYGRHRDARDVAELIRALEGPARLAVLDVGGYPGLSARFLPADWVVIVDPAAAGTAEAGAAAYLRASGLALPFQDASFDLVLSLDSLEHVPAADRPRYLDELRRVARRYVLLLAPFASPEAERAEALLFEYVKVALHAEHEQLREHRACGLPDLPATIAALTANGAACHAFPSGYLYHWLPLMLLKHHLLSLDPRAGVHAALDRWYNAREPSADRWLPAYRWAVLVSKAGETASLRAAAERFVPRAPDAAAELLARQDLQLVLSLLALERGNRGPAALEERLAHQERQIAALTHEVEALRAHLAAIRRGRIMRLLNAANHLLGRDAG